MNVTYDYARLFVWGGIVLAAYLGYGRTLARALVPSLVDRVGWGLLGVWGMSAVLLIGGLLLCLGQLSRASLDGVVGVGLLLLLVDVGRGIRRRRGQPPRPGSPWIHPLELLPWALLLIYYAGSVAWMGETDRNDDLVSYFAFPKLMLQTGGFHDPFGFRRMTSYGAQPFLQALTTARYGCELNYHFADCGLARVLFFGLVAGMLRPLRARSPLLLATLQSAIVLLPIPRNNTTSELIHAVVLLATPLSLLAVRMAPADAEPRRTGAVQPAGLWLCALVIFAASTFRPHIGFSAALLFAGGVLTLPGVGLSNWRRSAGSIAATGSLVVAMLLPWAVMLYQSSATLAFPPLRGNLSASFAGMHAYSGSPIDQLGAIFSIGSRAPLLAMLVPLLALSVTGSRLFKALALAALGLTALTASASTALSFPYFYRYVWPIPFAVMVFMGCTQIAALSASPGAPDAGLPRWRKPALLAAAFSVAAAVFLPAGVRYLGTVAGSIGAQLEAHVSPMRRNNQPIYERAQRAIPPGEAVLAMTDMPFLFDYARNPILTLDAPGAISPGGAMPFYQGPEKTRQYLLELGIAFVAYTPPQAAILQYRRDYWEHNPRPEAFYREVWAPPMLDMMDAIQSFRSNSAILYQHRKLEVLDLRTPLAES